MDYLNIGISFLIVIMYLQHLLAYALMKYQRSVTHDRQQSKLSNRVFYSQNLTNAQQTRLFPYQTALNMQSFTHHYMMLHWPCGKYQLCAN